MKRKAWQNRIKKACEEAGTYRPSFAYTISTLAGILEKRDEIAEIYDLQKDGPVIEFTNKNGSTNMVKNPLLVLWNDMNNSALAYWRDLGLTPAGLKRLDEGAFKPQKKNNNLLDLLAQRRSEDGA